MSASATNDAVYARRRESDERAAGAASVDMAARDAHMVLAERYGDRARLLEDRLSRVTERALIDDHDPRVATVAVALTERRP